MRRSLRAVAVSSLLGLVGADAGPFLLSRTAALAASLACRTRGLWVEAFIGTRNATGGQRPER